MVQFSKLSLVGLFLSCGFSAVSSLRLGGLNHNPDTLVQSLGLAPEPNSKERGIHISGKFSVDLGPLSEDVKQLINTVVNQLTSQASFKPLFSAVQTALSPSPSQPSAVAEAPVDQSVDSQAALPSGVQSRLDSIIRKSMEASNRALKESGTYDPAVAVKVAMDGVSKSMMQSLPEWMAIMSSLKQGQTGSLGQGLIKALKRVINENIPEQRKRIDLVEPKQNKIWEPINEANVLTEYEIDGTQNE